MIELQGKYNTAKVFTDNIESEAISQIIGILNQPFSENQKIRFMPDVHSGKGCCIGTSMTIGEKGVPVSLVGVDICCGMLCVKLEEKEIDFAKLDAVIRKYVPSGFSIHEKPHRFASQIDLDKLNCAGSVAIDRAVKSIGTLGGGNHMLELAVDTAKENLYLIIHTGSRNLGKQVAEYYEELAVKDQALFRQQQKDAAIAQCKANDQERLIQQKLDEIDAQTRAPKELMPVSGHLLEQYLEDCQVIQKFSDLNRKAIADIILSKMGLHEVSSFTTLHNYIDTDEKILRKGAISAKAGETVLIPMNMRDGSLLCEGLGNDDWNQSGPHGAGRLMSRSKAKATVSMDEYQESMKGIWTSSVCQSTLDESPIAYKPMDEIMENIQDTCIIKDILKPVYNFKAS